MIKAKLTGTSGAISSQLDSNEQQLEASLEKSTPQYVGGDGIDIDNGIISNTGVTSINGQTGDLDGFALSAEIPTKTSQLVNDSNYATTNQIPTDYYTQEEVNDLIDNVTVDLSDYYTKTESNDKFADKSEIPTSTSQLTNDSQFITNTVDNLTNYYKKTETYTQAEVNNLIGSITTISFQVVDNLPPTGEANVIYLVPNTQSTNNTYDEYIWVNNSWELIGSTSVDLSNYYTKTEADNKFALSADLASVATSGSYNDLTNKPTIPSKISDLTDDSTFVKYTKNENVSYAGKEAQTTYTYTQSPMVVSNGIIIGGTALNAGLVTRGICGVKTPTNTGECTKENLYINFDGVNTFDANRQLVLQAGQVGISYGSNLYQYAVPRGDIVKNWVESKGYAKATDLPTKTSDLTNDSGYQTAAQVQTAINTAIGTTSNLLGDTEDLS